MSINNQAELAGISRISKVVAETLQAMRAYARPGMHTSELDEYGAALLEKYGARSAPKLCYGFPGHTCISVNEEICHGIPSRHRVLAEGDLVNIDVSAELDGFFSDNGMSFVLGEDLHGHQALVDASRQILMKAIARIRGGVRIADVGGYIEDEAKKKGFRVIRNLTGHGIGRSLHEDPENIPNYRDRYQLQRFRKNTVVAVETFISTRSTQAVTLEDGWTMVGDKLGFVCQQEHTLLITDKEPVILTV